MSKALKIIFISLAIFGIVFYLFFVNQKETKPISIEPIRIEPLQIETKSKVTPPSDILLKFKQATVQSKENLQSDQEEIAKNILETLKTETETETETEIEIEIETETETETEIEIETIIESIAVALATEEKAPIHKTKIAKKVIPKKNQKTKKITKANVKKVIKRIKTLKKPKVTKKIIIVKNTKIDKPKRNKSTSQSLSSSHLTREEEVLLYKKKYANKLEVVGVSESFEIKNNTKKLPDSYYFKNEKKPKITATSTKPIGYVKKLGVVKVSNAYEVDLKVPKKIELAKEGIVEISTASIETEELKKLKFVDTLGVIDVSDKFETTEAKKYLP